MSMQEENAQQTVNPHLLITTVCKLLAHKFPEFRDSMTNLMPFLKRVEMLENTPHAFPHVSCYLKESNDIYWAWRGFRLLSLFWQFFLTGVWSAVLHAKSAIEHTTACVSNAEKSTALMGLTHWKGHFFHSRQRNEIVCIGEHFSEETAPSWLIGKGLQRMILYGHKAGIKCCSLPLAAKALKLSESASDV